MSFLKSKSKIFLSILVSFIIGVSIFLWWKPDFDFNRAALVLIISALLLIIIAVFWRQNLYVRFLALIFSFIFLGFIFCISYFHFFLVNPLSEAEKGVVFEGYICNGPEIGMNEVKYEVCLMKLDDKIVDYKVLLTADLYPKYQFGQIISVKGNLKLPGTIQGFDYQNYLLTKKIFGVIYKPEVNIKQEVGSEDIGWSRYLIFRTKGVLFKIKNKFEDTVNKIMHEPEASFLNGLMLGEKSSMSEELIDDFNRTGTTHIIALSGFNVTIIIFTVAALFGNLGKRNSFFVSLLFVVFFVTMTGAASSVVRAAVMVMLVLLAPLLGRKAKSINILIFTAAIMILFNPLILRYDLGFALSFLSLSGLILFAPLLTIKIEKSGFKRAPGLIKTPLIETLSAQLFAFPLILYSFSRVSIIAPLANALILPFIPLTMFLGFLSAVLGMIWNLLGQITAYFPFFFLRYMIVVVKLGASLPFASIEISKFPAILAILSYLLIILLVSFLDRKIMIKDGKTIIR